MHPYHRKLGFLILLMLSLLSCGGNDDSTSPDIDGLESGDLYVDIYDPEKACNGTTILTDLHDQTLPRAIEIDMQGTVVWEYVLPENLREFTQPGMDVEILPGGTILLVLPGYGLHEIDRNGEVIWTHLDPKISHDADRLVNGNTIYVFGDHDGLADPQIKEITSDGSTTWEWYARDHYAMDPYLDLGYQGWTHANAVTRLTNGNTLINLRNFGLTIEVTPSDSLVWEFDWNSLYGGDGIYRFDPHEPEIQPDDNVLICLQRDTPYQIVELDRTAGQPVWEYYREGLRTARDSDRLPNGNTLIVGVITDGDDSVIFEIMPNGEIVWQLKIKDTPATDGPGYFYKAQRICS